MTENALSILSVIFSVQLQQTEISERKLFIFHLVQSDDQNVFKGSSLTGHSVCSLQTLRITHGYLLHSLIFPNSLSIFEDFQLK